jgi:hypothetical protein
MRRVTGKGKRRRQEQEGTDKVKDNRSRFKRQMKGKEGETGARIDKRQVLSGDKRHEEGDSKREEKTTGTRGNGQSKE